MFTQEYAELQDNSILDEVREVGGKLIFETGEAEHICDCESWGSWD